MDVQPMPKAETASVLKQDGALRQQILGSFEGAITPRPVPAIYRLGLLLVAITMVLLPLVYIGLIGLTCYGLHYHATQNTALFQGSHRSSGMKVALFAYVAPLIAGGILVLFMIKPLFARRQKSEKNWALSRNSEPLLFEFVDRICQCVGSPAPREIRVDCQVNASAGFRHGILSLFGNDLVLTIGLPLASGLSLQQFGGVLAHEFGHFAQHAGMRLTYVIRSVSFWFARVVYERDSWDEALTAWSSEVDIRIGIVFYLARLFVWITRKILWVLMVVGHGVSCFMLRQMEYDADRYEAWLSGSRSFEETVRRMAVLSVATQGAHARLRSSWDEGRLADDLPALILLTVRELPKDMHAKIEQHIRETKTGLFDTHPADTDRIASAMGENATGILHSGLPAVALFGDFATLSRVTTFDFYREVIGRRVSEDNIYPVNELLDRENAEQEGNKALRRYFQDQVSVLRPLPLPGIFPTAPADPAGVVRALKQSREQLQAERGPYAEGLKKFGDVNRVFVARALLGARDKIDSAKYNLPRHKNTAAGPELKTAQAQQETLGHQLAGFEKNAGERVFAALGLLQSPQFAANVPGAAALQQEVRRLLPVSVMLGRMLPDLMAASNEHQALGILLNNIEGHEKDEAFINAITTRLEGLRKRLLNVREKLGTVEYPLDHANKKLSLREYALEYVPRMEQAGELVGAAEDSLNKLLGLYIRILGRLALAAEKVELAAGLAPLPDPPDSSDPPGEKAEITGAAKPAAEPA